MFQQLCQILLWRDLFTPTEIHFLLDCDAKTPIPKFWLFSFLFLEHQAGTLPQILQIFTPITYGGY